MLKFVCVCMWVLFTHPDSDFSHPPPYPCFSLRFSLLLHSPSWIMPYNNNLKVNQLICYYHLTWSSRLRIVPRPFGCRSRSRAGCPLRRSIPGQSRAVPRLRAAPDSAAAAAPPAPLPSRSAPAPPAALSAYLGAPARARLSEPAATAALLKKPERAAPLSFYVRAREQPPPPGPGRCSRAPGAPSFSVRSCPCCKSAPLLCPACPRLLADPGAPGAAWWPCCLWPGGRGAQRGGRVTDLAKLRPSPCPSLSPELHRRIRRGRVESKSSHGVRVVQSWLRPQASCFMCLAFADPSTPAQESVWHD